MPFKIETIGWAGPYTRLDMLERFDSGYISYFDLELDEHGKVKDINLTARVYKERSEKRDIFVYIMDDWRIQVDLSSAKSSPKQFQPNFLHYKPNLVSVEECFAEAPPPPTSFKEVCTHWATQKTARVFKGYPDLICIYCEACHEEMYRYVRLKSDEDKYWKIS